MNKPVSGITAALLSALLFGISTPFAKFLLNEIDPWLLAGLLYLGAGIGLGVLGLFRRGERAKIGVREWSWLLGAIAAGGMIGPVLLMLGLTGISGSSASLLLNAEGVFTALLAWFVFRENFDRRIALGMIAIMGGAVVLSWNGTAAINSLWPPLAILGACFFWALDNNLTRRVSLSDAQQITTIKGLVAGTTNVAIALALGTKLPALPFILSAGIVGFLGYGVSLTLFVIALRDLGTARTGAYFSTAPFVGAIIAIPLLGEALTVQLIVAGVLMAIGVWLHLTEVHEHEHIHQTMEHTHAHTHDEHHDHAHRVVPRGQHVHLHRHEPMRHKHPHYPDAHHRHDH
ncbi:MAG: EamA family transporter [Sneathiella sp.]|nr:EamA family transporter [Sneathiella sp.]